jgi:phosphoglycolate phosphatase
MPPASSRSRTVLFDLDGTVSDSAPGILGSLRQAFADVGAAPMTRAQEASVLGPPFYESLPALVGPERVADVIEAYRGYYAATGMFDTVAYPGMADVLDWLTGLGMTLAIATSKPEHYAVPILEHLGLAGRFTTICGDTLDGARASKALVVGEALRRLGASDPATTVMIGDRSHDVHGAAEHGLRCYGAGWGYGGPGELTGAGAVAVYASPQELRSNSSDRLGFAAFVGATASIGDRSE